MHARILDGTEWLPQRLLRDDKDIGKQRDSDRNE
jgi:hypothetical protein